jgi:hypothetical protein
MSNAVKMKNEIILMAEKVKRKKLIYANIQSINSSVDKIDQETQT